MTRLENKLSAILAFVGVVVFFFLAVTLFWLQLTPLMGTVLRDTITNTFPPVVLWVFELGRPIVEMILLIYLALKFAKKGWILWYKEVKDVPESLPERVPSREVIA